MDISAFIQCSGCGSYRHRQDYVGRTQTYNTCTCCRYRQTPPRLAPSMDSMISMDSLDIHYATEHISNNGPVKFDWDIAMSEEVIENYTDDQIIEEVIHRFEEISGYHFALKKTGDPVLRQSISFHAYCVQDQTIQRQLPEELQQRLTCRMNTYNCKGKVTGFFDREQLWVHVTYNHRLQHQCSVFTERNETPLAIREYIERHALNLDSAHLFRNIRQEFGGAPMITQAQVYKWYHHYLRQHYEHHDDQFISARILIQQNNNNGFEEVLGY
ncbi:uncharacterized protein BX664DRAFT_106363 [Halteromyces radiatus]|uniref:uncharacterized protein n=1 Tax=Halteromyces radiatus TaxID=101107 RepID=UPI002220B88A|nr:uncharacterized protein BX664DRAFT_106363 [Halteromyces radiatus]KAI8093392.1 hypothetical protein BX664DRAFT_106363 [Halteromyces radiatus]